MSRILVVEDGQADTYAGNYSDLVERFKEGIVIPNVAPPPPAAKTRIAAEGGGATSDQKADQKQRAKRVKKIDDEMAQLEERIAAAERDGVRNDQLLCTEEVFRDGIRVKKIQQQNADLKAMIELLTSKWEALEKEKEELETVSC